MAKVIKYKYLSCEVNHGTEEEPNIEQVFIDKTLSYSKFSEEISKREAHNGEYTIEDDGVDGIVEPTQLDRVESQVAYLAMMTGYEEILGV